MVHEGEDVVFEYPKHNTPYPDNSTQGYADFKNDPMTFQQDDQPPSEASNATNQEHQKIRESITERISELLIQSPDLPHQPLMDLNTQAARWLKNGDSISAAAIYTILFNRAATNNITHPELYVCHSNCSAANLKLELFEEALKHAEKCRQLAERSLRRNYKASSGYIKSFERKGKALMGLSRHREAAAAFEAGLQLDAMHAEMKKGLQEANQKMLEDLIDGRGMETRAIEYPEPSQRISYHPYSAPLHKVRTEDMLPVKLLTPFQAENDHNIKDTYNYVTIQTDIKMPNKVLRSLEDSMYTSAYAAAIQQAVAYIESEDKDCRVLNLGTGAGLLAALALQAGARHVTAVDRWLYLALTTKETLVKNEFDAEQYKVVYKRPTDLTIKGDVSVCCNLLITNLFDEGFLTSGIIPAMHHALSHLLVPDAILLPSSATVYMQAVEVRTTEACGLDLSAVNLYRWHPAYAAGVPWNTAGVKTLSEPVEVWYFSLGTPPDKSDVKTVDIEFTQPGRFNAIMFGFKIHLYGDIYLCTGPITTPITPTENQTASVDSARGSNSGNPNTTPSPSQPAGGQWLQPALQYLAGELPVDTGYTLPIICSHNTVRMRFDIETADYLHLMKPDASFPHRHFAIVADKGRLAGYQRAITRAVRKVKAQHEEVHVLDMGCGSGALAMFAAKAGANSVVACDLHQSLCDIARKAVAANKLSDRVSVVHRDVGLLQRGREVRPLGVNLVVADMFDSGLFGDQFPYLLELTRKKVMQPDAVVIPAAATIYCMGIELLTTKVEGVDLSEMNKYRWDGSYEGVRLADLPHKQLTAPVKVLEHFFDTEKRPRNRESMLKLPVIAEGLMNAVVFWFDLHLDEQETLTNAPRGIGKGGVMLNPQPPATEDVNSPSTSTAAEDSNKSTFQGVADESFDHVEAEEGSLIGHPPAEEQPQPQQHEEHYWGQALQYLDRSLPVQSGKKVALISKREGSKLTFSLRQGLGDWVDRAPWKIEWGGGASVENPHFQRVHYCELLVKDFLARVKSRRFPSIEKDMKMVLAHCGSLFLDPGALEEVSHELVLLEKLHSEPEFGPGASLEALTRRALRLC